MAVVLLELGIEPAAIDEWIAKRRQIVSEGGRVTTSSVLTRPRRLA
jgi:hypothetical protein